MLVLMALVELVISRTKVSEVELEAGDLVMNSEFTKHILEQGILVSNILFLRKVFEFL